MTAGSAAPRRSLATIERLTMQLIERDRKILLDLARVRVLSGNQLTRLHFSSLSSDSQQRRRRRIMGRLTRLGFVTTLERRVGGVRAGSAGLVYVLGLTGQRALPFLTAGAGLEPDGRARRPWTPGALFLGHALAVSELYVQLVEAERSGLLTLADYRSEPAAWFPSGMGGLMKPDAYALLRLGSVEDSWAIEVDQATESLPTLRRKLLAYVDFAHAGQVGPDGVTPRVLVTVPHEQRLAGVQRVIAELPEPAPRLFRVALFERAVIELVGVLRE